MALGFTQPPTDVSTSGARLMKHRDKFIFGLSMPEISCLSINPDMNMIGFDLYTDPDCVPKSNDVLSVYFIYLVLQFVSSARYVASVSPLLLMTSMHPRHFCPLLSSSPILRVRPLFQLQLTTLPFLCTKTEATL
jgi:hypothetical protein